MTAWVLVIILVAGGSASIAPIDYPDRDSCEFAATKWTEVNPQVRYAACLPRMPQRMGR